MRQQLMSRMRLITGRTCAARRGCMHPPAMRRMRRMELRYAQAIQQPIVRAPVPAHAHGQIQMHLTSQLALQLCSERPCRSP